jgi:hypothetical protein
MEKGSVSVEISVEWRSAPIAILEHKKLSAEAKVFLTWILMHQNNWKVVISYALKTTGISEAIWTRRVRKELIELGFFQQKRTSEIVDGVQRIQWLQKITDAPLRVGEVMK